MNETPLILVKWSACKRCEHHRIVDKESFADGLNFCVKNRMYATHVFEKCDLLTNIV